MNFKSKKAFSLAEMMVVMLILSLVMAASLPIITKRSNSSSSNNTDTIWQWASNGTDAYFGQTETQGAIIGSDHFISGTDATSKLMINTDKLGINHIMFKQSDTETGHMVVDGNGNVGLGKVNLDVAPPSAPTIENATAIGNGATAKALGSIAIGSSAIASATGLTPHDNGIAIGSGATASNGGLAIGYNAKAPNYDDTSIGQNALMSSSYNQYASENTAIGYMAMSKITQTYQNTAIGANSMKSNETSSYNTAIGPYALNSLLSGDGGNSAIGRNSLSSLTTGKNNTAIGESACVNVTGSNKTCIGAFSGPSGSFASDSSERIFIGSKSNFNARDAVLEVHNDTTARSVVIVNGDMVIRGRTYMNNGAYQGSDTGSVTNPALVRVDSYNMMKQESVFWTSSDKRLKNVGTEFKDGLNKINQLKTYNYTFKKDENKTPRVGVMAQDLQKVFPNAIKKDAAGHLTIRQEDIFYAMINSIKQLDKITQRLADEFKALVIKVQKIEDKITALIRVDQINSQRIKSLEAENKALKTRLSRLEHRIK